MLYQLVSGKVIYLSLEEYLSLSDRELHEIANSGYGEEPSYKSHFHKKTSAKKDPVVHKQQELDYTPESDETDLNGPVDFNNLPEE